MSKFHRLAPAAMLAASAIAASAHAGDAPPTDPAMAKLLDQGLRNVCSPFLAKPTRRASAVEAMAAKAGYELGAPDPYGPVGQAIPGAPPALAFHATSGAGPDAPMVELFLTQTPVACQMRVFRDGAAWGAFETKMVQQGAKLVTSATLTPETTYSHEVYVGGIRGVPADYTLFANRWVGKGDPRKGIWTMINVLPNGGVGN